jgi:hypothetical protein
VSVLPLEIVWTYARHGEQLRLRRVKTHLGLLLIESYPGALERSYFFSTLADLMRFQTSLTTHFEEMGWSIVEFAHEHAVTVQQRPERRAGEERRRWSRSRTG